MTSLVQQSLLLLLAGLLMFLRVSAIAPPMTSNDFNNILLYLNFIYNSTMFWHTNQPQLRKMFEIIFKIISFNGTDPDIPLGCQGYIFVSHKLPTGTGKKLVCGTFKLLTILKKWTPILFPLNLFGMLFGKMKLKFTYVSL